MGLSTSSLVNQRVHQGSVQEHGWLKGHATEGVGTAWAATQESGSAGDSHITNRQLH